MANRFDAGANKESVVEIAQTRRQCARPRAIALRSSCSRRGFRAVDGEVPRRTEKLFES